jgi:hypothetical protein
MRKGSIFGHIRPASVVIVYSTEQGTRSRKRFDQTTLVKEILRDASAELHIEPGRSFSLYCGQWLDPEKTMTDCGILHGVIYTSLCM